MNAAPARSRFEHDDLTAHLHRALVAAAAVLFVVMALLLFRELRVARSFRALADPPASADAVPAEAVSVPSLVLAAGREVLVGDSKSDALQNLASQTLVKRTEQRGPLGAREVRTYAGFTLVLEPFERTGEPRVAAIYVQ